MSIDAGAHVVIILLACRPCVVIVNCLGQVFYLGRALRTKETLPDFRECRVGYSTFTSISWVDELSTDTPVLGHHTYNHKPTYTKFNVLDYTRHHNQAICKLSGTIKFFKKYVDTKFHSKSYVHIIDSRGFP